MSAAPLVPDPWVRVAVAKAADPDHVVEMVVEGTGAAAEARADGIYLLAKDIALDPHLWADVRGIVATLDAEARS